MAIVTVWELSDGYLVIFEYRGRLYGVKAPRA
jgi:hypothetical protein